MIRAAAIAAGLVLAGVALAQEVAPPPPMADRLPRLREAPSATDGGTHFQALAMSGREDRIAAAAKDKPACAIVPGVNALDYIVERAQSAQIVMINEAHDSPQDRAFIAEVAAALSKLGFRTYAAETLFGEAPRQPQSYARSEDGFYLQEPTFGALFRRIADLGYSIVPYEDRGPRVDGRHFTDAVNAGELAQASNLINRTLRVSPEQKVLVHVGYGHNQEAAQRLDGREVRFMAFQFKQITGIDPLTIDQTTFTAGAEGVCAAAESAPRPDRDIFVARPPLTFERNRPTWRLAAGQRFADVPQTLRQPGARTIIEARYASEPDDAVPVDRILIDPGEDIPLLLPPGRYRLRGWTASGGWSENASLAVAAPARATLPQKAKAKSTQRRKKR